MVTFLAGAICVGKVFMGVVVFGVGGGFVEVVVGVIARCASDVVELVGFVLINECWRAWLMDVGRRGWGGVGGFVFTVVVKAKFFFG